MKQLVPIFLYGLLMVSALHAQPLCTSTCTGALGENIYPNGDFGAGTSNVVMVNPGLAPGYVYQTNPPPNDGYYTLSNNTTPWGTFANQFWINIEDNGPEPNGYMMVVNASYPPGLFFKQTVPVCENTLYEFSADVINLFQFNTPPSILPNLSFLVDNVVHCETGDIPVDEKWHTVRFSFTTAPGQTTVVLSMQNNAPGGFGNDLAIDNLSFRACGPEILTPPIATYCQGTLPQLESQIVYTPYDTTVYQWQVLENGVWVDIPGANTSPWILEHPQDSGQYRLLVASGLTNLNTPSCRVASAPIQLQLLPGLQVQSSANDAYCLGSADGAVNAQPSTGIAPFSYSWSTGASTGTVTGLAAGIYTVTITDALGCTGVASQAVDEPPALQPDLHLIQQVSCFGAADAVVSAFVSGGTPVYGFSWNTGAVSDTVGGLPAGDYVITVTDDNGCTQTAAIVITEPPALQLEASATDVFCFGGNNGTLTALAAGGTAPIGLLWNNGATNDSLPGLSAGIYSLTATDAAGCSETMSVAINEPQAIQILDQETHISCFGGSDGQILLNLSGGTTPYLYQWNNGQSQAQLNGLPAGSYSLTVTDAMGCRMESSMELFEPPPLAVAMQLLQPVSCYGGADAAAFATAAGGAPPYQWLWNNGAVGDTLLGIAANLYMLTATDAHGCTQTVSMTVDEPPALEASITATDVSCYGLANGQIAVQVSGGVGPYLYQWNDAAVQTQPNALPAGNYSLTLTDANGCPAYTSAAIQQPDSLVLTTNSTAVSCFGAQNGQAGIVISGGVGPFELLWNNGQTATQLTNLAPGNYQATVTDQNGCSAHATAQVPEPPEVVATTNADPVKCYGGSTGSAWVQPLSGQAPFQFLWNNGATGQQLTGLTAGNYLVTVMDITGCTATSIAIVTQAPLLELSATATNVACAGGADGALSATATGGAAPYDFWLNNGQNGPIFQHLTAGNYVLIAIDVYGCTDSMTLAVQEPPLLTGVIQQQPVACAGASDGEAALLLSGGTPPYQFQWNTGENTAALHQILAGNYQVTASDAKGCTVSAAVQITEPPALLFQTTVQDVDCYGASTGSAWSHASGGAMPYSFNWQTGAGTAQVQGLSAGWYGVTVTDANGCLKNAQVLIGEPPPLLLSTISAPASCPEVEDGRLSALASGGVAPYLFAWNNGQSSAENQNLASGIYTVTVTDSHGCQTSSSTTVLEAVMPSVALGLDQTVNLGEEINLSASSNLLPGDILDYTWSGDGGSAQCPDCFQYRFVPIADGCETVLIRSRQGCQASDEVCFKVRKPRNIYVPNIFTPDDNGLNDYFTIYSDASVDRIRYLSVYSRWGEQVFLTKDIPTNHEPSGWDGYYRGQLMNPGVFAWVAEVEFIDGEVVLLKGDVTLFR